MIVKLNSIEQDQVKEWALARTAENANKASIADYDTRRFHLTSYQNNVLGLAAELAVVKALGLNPYDESIWLPFVPRSRYAELRKPDIAGVVEVRSIRKPTNPLAVRQKDIRAQAVLVQVYTPHSFDKWDNCLVINGYLEAQKAWEIGTVPEWSQGDSKTVPQSHLKPFEELRLIDHV